MKTREFEGLEIKRYEKDQEIYDLKMLLVELRHIYLFNIDTEKNEIKAPMKRIISIWERVHEALKDEKERIEQ